MVVYDIKQSLDKSTIKGFYWEISMETHIVEFYKMFILKYKVD